MKKLFLECIKQFSGTKTEIVLRTALAQQLREDCIPSIDPARALVNEPSFLNAALSFSSWTTNPLAIGRPAWVEFEDEELVSRILSDFGEFGC